MEMPSKNSTAASFYPWAVQLHRMPVIIEAMYAIVEGVVSQCAWMWSMSCART